MNTDLDELLAADGRRWRGTLGPDPDLTELLTAARRRRRRVLAPTLAAAAAVALAVASIVATHLHHGRAIDDRPAAPTPRCQDNFSAPPALQHQGRSRFSVMTGGVTTPVPEYAVRLTYLGEHPCTITRVGPRVQVVDAAGAVLGTQKYILGSPGVTVVRGDVVGFSVAVISLCPQVARPTAAVRVRLDGGTAPHTGIDVPAAISPRCLRNPDGSGTTDIQVADVLTGRERVIGIKWSNGPTTGADALLRPGTVRISRHGKVISSHELKTGEAFLTRLAAGTYRISAATPNAVCPDRTVVIPEDQPSYAVVNIRCALR